MILDLHHEVINKYIPRLSLTINKLNCKTTLKSSIMSKICQKNILWKFYLQTNSITNIKKVVTKCLFTQQFIKNLERIFVMMLKTTLKIWKYIKNKRKTNANILKLCKLINNKNVYCEADYSKAKALVK